MKDVALSRDEAGLNRAEAKVDELQKGVLADFMIIAARFLGRKSMYRRALSLFVVWKPIRNQVTALVRARRSSLHCWPRGRTIQEDGQGG